MSLFDPNDLRNPPKHQLAIHTLWQLRPQGARAFREPGASVGMGKVRLFRKFPDQVLRQGQSRVEPSLERLSAFLADQRVGIVSFRQE